MKERTLNPNTHNYSDYGGAGIGICEDFKTFSKFYDHIGPMPVHGKYSLGRKDNSLGYVTGNVEWQTDRQQARNKGKNNNNTSGFSGVLWNNKKTKNSEKLYAVATWYNLDGKMLRKYFSVDTLGLIPAFCEACRYRVKMIEELNAQGAGYSPNHGK
jgi:hypothetical protein